MDDVSALNPVSIIRIWNIMVPSWSEGDIMSNNGKRRVEVQLRRDTGKYIGVYDKMRKNQEEYMNQRKRGAVVMLG